MKQGSLKRRAIVVALSLCIPTAFLIGCADADTDSQPPQGEAGPVDVPILADPAESARKLVTRWLEALAAGESVEDLIAPNFQIQRSDGSTANRDQYLAQQATISEFEIGDELFAYQSGRTLTVRWTIRVTEEVAGSRYENVVAPRLTVFEWIDGTWLIVGYANFNPVSTLPDEDAADSQPSRVSLGSAELTPVSGSDLRLDEVTIPPGVRLPSHFHEGVQIGHVVSGELTYTIEEGSTTVRRVDGSAERVTGPITIVLEPGDWLVEDQTLIHHAENLGEIPVVVLVAAVLFDGAPSATPVGDGVDDS